MDERGWRALHVVVGVVACVVVPVVTRLASPSGGLSWTMFARARRYRLELVAVTAGGDRRTVRALDVARALGPPQGAFVAGLDSGLVASASSAPRRALGDLARIACRLSPGADHVEAALEESDPEGAADVRRTALTRSCVP